MAISRALLSVSDKSGLVDLAKSLHEEHGVELLSTGGTAKAIREAGRMRAEGKAYVMADGDVERRALPNDCTLECLLQKPLLLIEMQFLGTQTA